MSRDDGFAIADIDVGVLRDVKVRRLRQQVPDDFPATVVLYLAVVLSSWEDGLRLSALEADSVVEATAERIAGLKAVELLDEDGKIPAHAWESWFRPAWERREASRAGGREGNRRRWGTRSSVTDSPPDSHPESPSLPSVPTVSPSYKPPDSRALGSAADEDGAPEVDFRTAMERAGLYPSIAGVVSSDSDGRELGGHG
jgi:hypothetical protein